MADDWEPIPITITPERVEQWYRGKTSPRDLAYKAVWLRLIAGKTEPTVWRTIEAALAAYEGSPNVAAAESRGRAAGYAEAVQALRDGAGYEMWCADTGRYRGDRVDHAAYLEWIASRATTEETPR